VTLHEEGAKPGSSPEHAIIDLDYDMPVTADVLGKSIDTVIGGNAALVALPNRDPRDAEYLQVQVPQDASPLQRHATDECAGFMVDDHRAMVRLLAVNFADGTGEDLRALAEATVVWGGLVEEWLGALGGCTRPGNPVSRRRGPILTNDVSGDRVRRSGNMTTLFPAGGPSADPAMVVSAFAHAGRGQRPSLPWQLLVAAQRHGVSGDGRRAIVDVATAVEVALSTPLRIHLARAGLKDRTMKRLLGGGTVRLIELYRSEIGELSVRQDAIVRDVCDPRNSAIHEGAVPTMSIAWDALRTARELLTELAPIDGDPTTGSLGSIRPG